MEVARKAGIKMILRFAYSLAMDEPDAPLAVIRNIWIKLNLYSRKIKM